VPTEKYVPDRIPNGVQHEGLKTSEEFNAKAQTLLETISLLSKDMTTNSLIEFVEYQSSSDPLVQKVFKVAEENLLQNLVFKALLEPLGKEILLPSDRLGVGEIKMLMDHAAVNTDTYLQAVSKGLESKSLTEEKILEHLQRLAKELQNWSIDD